MTLVFIGIAVFLLIVVIVHILYGFRAVRLLRYLRFVLKESPLVCLELSEDEHHVCRFASSTIEECLGFKPSDFTLHFIREYIHPDDFPLFENALSESLYKSPIKFGLFFERGKFSNVIFRMRHSSLDWCWIEMNGFFTKRNGVNVIVCFLKRYDDFFRLREEVFDLEMQQKMLLQSTFDIVWKLDVLSRQFTLLTDISGQIGLDERKAGVIPSTDIIFPEEEVVLCRNVVNRRVKALLENKKKSDDPEIYVVRLRNKDGSMIWCRTRSIMHKDEYGNFSLLGVSRQISAKEVISDVNLDSDVLFRTLISFPGVCFFLLDSGKKIIECNPAFTKNVGFSNCSDINGKMEDDIFPENSGWSSFRTELDSAFDKMQMIANKIVNIKNALGVSYTVSCNFSPIFNENGSLNKFLCMYTPVSPNTVESDKDFSKIS